jgi:Holliday junction resolvasome, DNA-binding subunit
MNIKKEDSSSLMRISGVGKKTAERLVIEMRDKFDSFAAEMPTEKDLSGIENSKKEAFDALLALGYKASDVNKMMSKLKTTDKKTDEIIRMALKKANN